MNENPTPEDRTKAARRVVRDTLEKQLQYSTDARDSAIRRAMDREAEAAALHGFAEANEARILEFKAALEALDQRETVDANIAAHTTRVGSPKLPDGFVAVMNVPGYLPWSDEPSPTFQTAREAWQYLADERKRVEDEIEDQPPYSEAWSLMQQLAAESVWMSGRGRDPDTLILGDLSALARSTVDERGRGSVWATTPGYDGDHDLGITYSVMSTDAVPDEELTSDISGG